MTFIDIFLIPFYLFKYGIALIAWMFLYSFIVQSSWYFRTKEYLIDKYEEIRS